MENPVMNYQDHIPDQPDSKLIQALNDPHLSKDTRRAIIMERARRLSTIPFGKHKGQKIVDIPSPDLVSLYKYCESLNRFDDVQHAIYIELRKRFPNIDQWASND